MLALLLAAAVALSPITIKIAEKFVMTQLSRTTVNIFIPSDPDNTGFGVEWVGEGSESSEGITTRQLDGKDDPTYFLITLRLTPGTYSIVGILFQKNGKSVVTPAQFVQVIGPRPDF